MATFELTANGATIEITNSSVATTFDASTEGFISPTLVSTGNVVAAETIPAFTIKVPSFVTYKLNAVKPGDTISFVSTKVDEILYYKDLQDNPVNGVTVTVTPIEE